MGGVSRPQHKMIDCISILCLIDWLSLMAISDYKGRWEM